MLMAVCVSACDFSKNSGSNSSSSVSSSNTVTSSSEIDTSTSKSSSISSSSSSSSSSSVSSSNSSSSSSQSSSSSSSSNSSSSSSSSSLSSSSSSSTSLSSSSSSSSSSQRPTNVSLDIFAFNDTHGNVIDTQGKGLGLSKTTTLLKEISTPATSIFISQGDMWQGSVESGLTRGNIVTEWMNSMDFVSMTVGNHEFDWGQEYVVSNQELANFPTLGINVLYRSNNQRVNYLSPSTTFTRNGAKIGVIGAIGNCYSSISRSKVADISFATGYTLTNLVKAEATRLRNEEKCDFIIYSIHGCNTDGDYDTELSTGKYVDLVLEGHTHSKYAELDAGGVYHVQSNAYNENFYRITVDLNLANSTYTVNTPVSYNLSSSTSPYRNYAEDTETKAIFDKYKNQYQFAYDVSGYNDTNRYASELKQTVADLYYEYGNTTWGSQYNLILGGGYISCRGSNLPQGDVTYADLYTLFPFDNDISLCSISGKNLRNTQFITGSSNYYTKWSSYGESIRYNIDDYTTYYLVTDTYTVDYYTSLNVIAKLENGGVYARDLLNRFIADGGYGAIPIETGHQGTLEDPRIVQEALEYAYTHPGSSASAAGSLAMYYKGVVSRQAAFVSSQGDMSKVYIKDAGTDYEIMIYYLKKTDGNKYGTWNSVNDLQLGDELIIFGRAFYYNSTTPEFDNQTYVYSINGVPVA